ncbi:MAG: hypothetical protein ACREC2_13290, partial [Bradyrhizobium sp.]
MIPRYTRPEMASIWEAQTRFKIWFEIEAHAADAQADLGVIPREAAKAIWAKAGNATFDVARIDLREGADRTRNCAGRDFLAGSHQTRAGAAEFRMGEGKLQTERDGLGMNA